MAVFGVAHIRGGATRTAKDAIANIIGRFPPIARHARARSELREFRELRELRELGSFCSRRYAWDFARPPRRVFRFELGGRAAF